MVRVADLVDVPALTDALAQQYSEGCFATFDPVLRAQIVTVTGSGQPVQKASLVEDDAPDLDAIERESARTAARPDAPSELPALVAPVLLDAPDVSTAPATVPAATPARGGPPVWVVLLGVVLVIVAIAFALKG